MSDELLLLLFFSSVPCNSDAAGLKSRQALSEAGWGLGRHDCGERTAMQSCGCAGQGLLSKYDLYDTASSKLLTRKYPSV